MQKESGVLLHITSLPGKYGIGTIGQNAYDFIDFLKEAGFSYWEILPLFETGYSNSPFQVITAFGYHYYLIDFDLLIKDGLLTSRDLKDVDFGENPRKVDFDKIYQNKRNILLKAYRRFNKEDPEFLEFIKNNNDLFKFALYRTIKFYNNDKAWFDFQLEDRYYNDEIKEDYLKNKKDTINFYLFIQYIFLKQWNSLKRYAKENNIDIIGDLPHFLGFDSDAMYLENELFLVDKYNLVTHVAGFPPDEFKKEGQRWGYPLYDWSYLKLRGYKFWNKRLAVASTMFDRIKLNHFRGFKKVYAIPFRAKNAKKGIVIDVPGYEFLKDNLDKKMIASVLGTYNKEIIDFAKSLNIPRLKVFLPNIFAKTDFVEELLPSNLEEDIYLYLENHDHLSLKGFIEESDESTIELAKTRLFNEAKKLNIPLKENYSSYELNALAIEIAFFSKANHVTLTMPDILFEGKNSRMNTPGFDNKNNWAYRFLKNEISNKTIQDLKELNIKTNRINQQNFKKN